MITKNLDLLLPEVKAMAKELITQCLDNSITLGIVETLRTQETQNVYFLQGREPLEKVNAERKKLGLWEISADENSHTITDSKIIVNIYGIGHGAYMGRYGATAFDACPIVNNKFDWNTNMKTWIEIGAIADRVGLEWGGTWKGFPDVNHFQIKHIELEKIKDKYK